MNTENTEQNKGWVFYDAHCPFCRRWVERSRAVLLRRGFHWVPLQAPWARGLLGIAESDSLVEMKLLTAGGKILGGADVLLFLARAIWWAWPVQLIGRMPGVHGVVVAAYRWVARNRHCDARACAMPVYAGRHHHRSSSFYELP